MIFGGFMVLNKIIKLLWKRFDTIYEKNINKYIYIKVIFSKKIPRKRYCLILESLNMAF